uniref:Uncharacterized protein n=1 Tax=viral metagenome TaxID=1070528 RepID=A0A6C0DSW1_9ZZZZ
MSKVFITFGAGSQDYLEAVQRLTGQARALHLFDSIVGFTDVDLRADEAFWAKHGTFIEKHNRGFGYWIWKPYLILKTMQTLKDGDLLLYADAGCEIDVSKRHEMQKSFEIAKLDRLVGTTTPHREISWSKMDVVRKIDVVDPCHLNTDQRQATAILFLVCPETSELVSKWYELACDYHLIDDSRSNAANIPEFCQHRHDQSIFSLLSKKLHLYSLRTTLRTSIRLSRNRTGLSILPPSK